MNHHSHDQASITIMSYEITFEPLKIWLCSQEVQTIRNNIFHLVAKNPKQALQELLILLKKYPNDPILSGYLLVAYERTKNKAMATQTIINNYAQFPNYLFAHCAYIKHCLSNDHIDEATEIMDKKFTLKALYPERSLFSIQEAIVFADTCIHYFCAINDFDQAEIHLDMLKQLLNDNDPIIEQLEKTLFSYRAMHYVSKMQSKKIHLKKCSKQKNIS